MFFSTTSPPSWSRYLSICHLNIQSIVPKDELFQYEILPSDIFIFTESCLHEKIQIFHFKDLFRCYRGVRFGGVAINVKEKLEVSRRTDLERNSRGSIWLNIKIRGHNVIICGMYRPPNSSSSNWNLFQEFIDRAKSTSIKDILILDDLNNDMFEINRSRNLREIFGTFNLSQVINEETHFTEFSW